VAAAGETVVRLKPWGRGDLGLLHQLVGDPVMMEHLGGAEPPKKIFERQRRYEAQGSAQYKIVVAPGDQGVGWVGYWERDWRGEAVYEIGWSVLPAFQGRGIAGAATALAVELARARGARRFVHAFPSVENGPSNGICRKLGFELVGPCDFEYPPGEPMLCNDWRLDLLRRGAQTGPP
jgi:RimJ/RimL family protein N-acetyltransferase